MCGGKIEKQYRHKEEGVEKAIDVADFGRTDSEHSELWECRGRFDGSYGINFFFVIFI